MAAALGLTGATAFEFVAHTSLAHAIGDVQYQYPFALSCISGNYRDSHGATDFGIGGVTAGSAIPAIADGVVTSIASGGGMGYRIELLHPDGVYSGYCHMQEPTELSLNDNVTRGTIVGLVGNSGVEEHDPHLHLAMATVAGAAIYGRSYANCFPAIPYITERLEATTNNQEEEQMGVMYYATGPAGTTNYTTVASTTSTGAAHPGGTSVVLGSMWFQECPGGPIFPMSGGAVYNTNPAMILEFEGWADQRPTSSRYEPGTPTDIGKLIQLRGQTVQPIGNFA